MKTNNQNNLIEKYLQGNLTETEQKEINALIKSDSFFEESLNGYKKRGASPSDLSVLDNSWNKKPEKRNHKYFIAASLSTAAAIALICIYFFNFKQSNIKYNPNQTAQFKHIPSLGIQPIIIRPDQDTIRDNENINPQNIEDFNYTAENIPEKESENFSPLYRILPKTIITDKNDTNDICWASLSNHLYGYINTYKIVDYRVDQRLNKRDYTIPTNRTFNTEYTNSRDIEISYMEYLNIAINKFQNQKYETALDDFRTILQQYPEDMNALFYSGLCHYYKNRPEKCIFVMEEVLTNNINTFDEEAQWYKAMSYKEKQNYNLTAQLLIEIANSDGYYGAKAHEELKMLEDIK
jgi:tetratricopeptide (TPR) repeat protein